MTPPTAASASASPLFASRRGASWLLAAALTLCYAPLALAQSNAQAKPSTQQAATKFEPKREGLRTQVSLAYRSRPVGLALFNDTGYRKLLSNSESLLLKNTYIEGGVASIASPAYIRSGAYVEAVPVSVLQLRSTLQGAQYFGTFGFLMVPPDQSDPDWSIEEQLRSADEGRGVSGQMLYWENRATPRVKIKRFVGLAEVTHTYIRSSLDEIYYEPFYDMLIDGPNHLLSFRPTLAGLPIQNDDTYLLTGVRYDRSSNLSLGIRTAQLNGLLIWGLPKSWVGGRTLALTTLYGYWLEHPNPREGTSYFAVKINATFGAQ